MFRVPLFRDVWYTIAEALGIRWDGVQDTHWAVGWKLGGGDFFCNWAFGIEETGIERT